MTVEDFYKEDPRRISGEVDYGVWWRDRGSDRVHRVTLIEATGELIAVPRGQTGDEAVELLGVIPNEDEVDRRLADWAYVGETVASLSWVRQRAIGWRVPLPPRSRWLKRQEQATMQPWPVPPTPSPKRAEGAYHGSKRDNERRVEVVDADGARALHHHVRLSPTGFAWGYSGSGPTDLARSLLADRLGYVPQRRVYFAFREDIVAHLPRDFVLTFDQVDRWIDEHGPLFADNPRAEPFDQYAAGGR